MSSGEEVTNWRNVRAISVFTFVDSLQFSFFMWSFWPYVQHLSPGLGATFVGFIMAISGVGEAVAAPVLGYWSNRDGRIGPPVYFSIVLSAIGNVLYMILDVLPVSIVPPLILISRFLNGAGSGNRGCFRALVAANSLGADRAKALASSGGAALIGLTIGPSFQVFFTPLGSDGIDLGVMRLSQYTAPALLALIINITSSLYMFTFLDDNLDPHPPKPAPLQKTISTIQIAFDTDDEKDAPTPPKKLLYRMDVIAVIITMGTRAIRMLVTSNMESIGAPFTEMMFEFSHEEALKMNSYAQTAVGGLTIATFLLYAFTNYTLWVSERTNCMVALLGLFAFYGLTMPWPFLSGHVDCTLYVGNGSHYWPWCEALPQINVYLYYISYAVFYGIALSLLNNSLQALYSRVLGSGRQGLMQGVSQTVGCVARIFGPLLMSSTFSNWGPQVSWGLVLALVTLTIAIWLAAYRRLVPVEHRVGFEIDPDAPSSAEEGISWIQRSSQSLKLCLRRLK